jgi:hypothetical protein
LLLPTESSATQSADVLNLMDRFESSEVCVHEEETKFRETLRRGSDQRDVFSGGTYSKIEIGSVYLCLGGNHSTQMLLHDDYSHSKEDE